MNAQIEEVVGILNSYAKKKKRALDTFISVAEVTETIHLYEEYLDKCFRKITDHFSLDFDTVLCQYGPIFEPKYMKYPGFMLIVDGTPFFLIKSEDKYDFKTFLMKKEKTDCGAFVVFLEDDDIVLLASLK